VQVAGVELNKKLLESMFDLRQRDAAKSLGMGSGSLAGACRNFGIN